MYRHRACAAGLFVVALNLCSASAVAQSGTDPIALKSLEASWCTAPHDDYRRESPMIDIRQFQDVRVDETASDGRARTVTARMRSAMVSAQTRRIEFVGAWVDYRFDVLNDSQLKDPSIGLALSLAPDRIRLAYKYGESRSYAHEQCGQADIELVAKAPLPEAIRLSAAPLRSTAQATVRTEATVAAIAGTPSPESGSAGTTAVLNKSHCLAMERTPTGFFGLVNKCTTPTNYTYCTLDATTANGRLALCRNARGEQIGEASGFLRPGDTAYLSLPIGDKGRVIWFACEYPATPALTQADPPSGRCQ